MPWLPGDIKPETPILLMKKKLSVLCFLWFACMVAGAQVSFYNNGILKLSVSGDIVYINGAFTNTSSASLTNNGQLYVQGNLDNSEGSMTAGTGTLYLNGSSAQTISGSQPFNTFNLVTNNSSGITLNNNLSISGIHTFTGGIITTSATPNYLVYESGASYSGSADSRHVNGWVKKTGSDDFEFPAGDGTYLRPVQLKNISGASEFNVKYFSGTPYTNQLQSPIQSVNAYEYWQINKVSGGSSSVHLNWDNSKVTFPPYQMADIAASFYDGSNWTDQGGSATGNILTTGDITSNSVSSFGYFVIGSKSLPLPLKFISFTAQRKENYTDLRWVTADETNTERFEIERSENGTNFSTIFSMPAINRPAIQEYTYKDFRLVNGIAFYRIRCVDIDGKYKYSKVAAVYESSYLNKNIMAMNPVRDEIIIRTRSDEPAPVSYTLLTEAGQVMLKGKLQLKAGTDNTIRLPFRPVHGIYFLRLHTAGKEYVQKLLIN